MTNRVARKLGVPLDYVKHKIQLQQYMPGRDKALFKEVLLPYLGLHDEVDTVYFGRNATDMFEPKVYDNTNDFLNEMTDLLSHNGIRLVLPLVGYQKVEFGQSFKHLFDQFGVDMQNDTWCCWSGKGGYGKLRPPEGQMALECGACEPCVYKALVLRGAGYAREQINCFRFDYLRSKKIHELLKENIPVQQEVIRNEMGAVLDA